jgi:hypothetical protein
LLSADIAAPEGRASMNESSLTRAFDRIGARVKLGELPPNWWRPIEINVKVSRRGEIFTIDQDPEAGVELTVISIDRPLRHLLLHDMGRGRSGKFLCGHDERHWFAAGVRVSGVTSVRTAMQALESSIVAELWAGRSTGAGKRLRRRNPVSIRQGEWFFVRHEHLVVPEWHIHRNWPLQRWERGKSHILEECYRQGQQTIYSCPTYPSGITEKEYVALVEATPCMKYLSWETVVTGPDVYARGRVRHPDHATLHLDTWHRVLVNREHEAYSSAYVTFPD